MELVTFRVLEIGAYGTLLLCELLGPSKGGFSVPIIVLIANMFVAALTVDPFVPRPWTLSFRVLLIAFANMLLAASYAWYAADALHRSPDGTQSAAEQSQQSQQTVTPLVYQNVIVSVASGLCLLHAVYAALGLSVREGPRWGDVKATLCFWRAPELERRQVRWKDPMSDVLAEEGRAECAENRKDSGVEHLTMPEPPLPTTPPRGRRERIVRLI